MQVVFTNVLILFILMFIGYILGIRKVVSLKSISDLTYLLVDVSIPCTIVMSLIRPFSQKLMNDTYSVIIIMVVYHVSMAALSFFLAKILRVDKKKFGSWVFALVFSNNGFIGFPLMYSLFGNDGLFIMAMGNIVQNVLIFSLGIKLTTLYYDNDTDKIKLRNIIFTRQNIATAIGLIIFIGQIPVPKPITTILGHLSSLTVPLSMLVVGLSMSKYKVKDMFTDTEAYRMTFFRMVFFPAILVIAFKLIGINANEYLPVAIMFYTAALPAPAFTTIFAERYNTSVAFSSKCVFISTLVSIITVPLFAGLL